MFFANEVRRVFKDAQLFCDRAPIIKFKLNHGFQVLAQLSYIQAMLSIKRVQRAFSIYHLTRRYIRAKHVPESGATYFLNDKKISICGPHHLSMVLDIISNDVYGLRQLNTEIKTIVDIGANIGIFSIYAKLRFPRARVTAVEPGRVAQGFLTQNTEGLDIQLLSYAVGSTDGAASLSITDDLTSSHISEKGADGASQPCEMITFQSVVDRLTDPIDLLKLDCEGAEYHVFASRSLDSVHSIRAELHTCIGGNPRIGLQQLRTRGFRITKWLPFPDGLAGIVWADREKH